jgi:hypothetical protein
MSVVVSDNESGKIFLMSKGADEAILPLAYSGNRPFLVQFKIHLFVLYLLTLFLWMLTRSVLTLCLCQSIR